MTRALVLPAFVLTLALSAASIRAQEKDPREETSANTATLPKPADTAPAPEDSVSQPAPPRSPRRRGKAVRTLDEITIEGEIAVPQVLFITARDRQRYQDLLHRRYRRSSLELGRATALPTFIIARF